MKYSRSRLGAAILAGTLAVLSAGSASAGWGHLRGGGSGGFSYGSGSFGSTGYASLGSGGSGGYQAYSSVGASVGGSSGGPGLLQRVAARWRSHMAAKRARHAARRSYASYGSAGYASYGSYGSYGSTGYTSYRASGGSTGVSYRRSYASTGASYGSVGAASYGSVGRSHYGSVGATSYGSTGSTYGAGYGSTGATYGAGYGSAGATSYGSVGSAGYGSVGGYYGASNAGSAPVASLVSNISGDEVYLTVSVPSQARVYVNDKLTTSTGTVRQFVSRGLTPDKTYRFEVRAELPGVEGDLMVENKEVKVSAGNLEHLAFTFSEQALPIETAVTLNVPEDAQVTLAGSPTKATGDKRVFRTNRLKPGDAWDDYEIEVRLGDQVKSRSIRLLAGDDLQLTFAFDDSADERLAAK